MQNIGPSSAGISQLGAGSLDNASYPSDTQGGACLFTIEKTPNTVLPRGSVTLQLYSLMVSHLFSTITTAVC